MQAEVDTLNAVLCVRFYGMSPGRQVTQPEVQITNRVPASTEPKYVFDPELPAGAVRQTDTARGGFDVTFGHIVREGDTLLYEDTFFSR